MVVLQMVATHHERADGSCYPQGLNNQNIPMFGRIAGIVDSYDAMTTTRPFLNAGPRTPHEVFAELYELGGSKFHAELVKQFIQTVGLYPTGSLVELVRYAGSYNAPIGLLLIDIRRFHIISKNFGHDAGDVVLLAVADVLKRVCREGDFLARIGDDQFALLLSRVANVGHAQLAAIKIQRLLEAPIRLMDREIHCADVVGISLYPSNASDADTLLKTAEMALEQAKHGEDPVGVSTKKIETEISQEWDMEVSLDQAIAHSELRVFFQPKISLATGKPVGAEALVRWKSSTRGLVAPDVFLPVAETIGLMKPLTIWPSRNSTYRETTGSEYL